MKQMRLFALLAVALFSLLPAPAVLADCSKPVTYTGSLELRIPTWKSGSGYVSDAKPREMAGDIKVFNLLPARTVLWATGEHTFHQAGIYRAENKLKVGIAVPLGQSPFSFLTYYDHRFADNVDRVFVGLRYGFHGSL